MSGSKHALAIRVLEDLRRGHLAISQALTYSAGARSRYRDDAAALLVSIDALKADQLPGDDEIIDRVAKIRLDRERVTGRPYHEDRHHFLACAAGDLEVAIDAQGLTPAVMFLVEHRVERHAGADPFDLVPIPPPS